MVTSAEVGVQWAEEYKGLACVWASAGFLHGLSYMGLRAVRAGGFTLRWRDPVVRALHVNLLATSVLSLI